MSTKSGEVHSRGNQCDGQRVTIRVEGRLNISSNEVAIAASVANLGIVSTALWGCRAELESGVLVRVLDNWEMESVEVNALFPAGHATKPSARAFVDYLADGLPE